MARRDFLLYNSDIMRTYIADAEKLKPVRGLTVHHNDKWFAPIILHATIDEQANSRQARLLENAQHSHPDIYHIVCYTVGEASFACRDEAVWAENGTVVLTGPGERHMFGPLEEDKCLQYNEVTFSLQESGGEFSHVSAAELLRNYAGLEQQEMTTCDRVSTASSEVLAGFYTSLLDVLELDHPLARLRTGQALGSLWQAVIELICNFTPEHVLQSVDARLEQARQWLEAHYREQTRVEDLAAMSCLSRGYFLRAFKQKYGTSPLGYRTRLRISAAKTLLTYSYLPLASIAQRLGFSDEYHFSKTFRHHLGMPPGAYRKQNVTDLCE